MVRPFGLGVASVIGLALVLAALAPVSSRTNVSSLAVAEGLPLLSHHGRWLTDPRGRVVVLHGVQIDHWEPSAPVNVIDLSPANVQFIAAMGFNLARVSMTYSGVAPTPGSFDQSYVNSFVSFDQ